MLVVQDQLQRQVFADGIEIVRQPPKGARPQGIVATAMSLTELAINCQREIMKYRRREASDDQYALEMLRRAFLERNDEAWARWQDQMNEQVRNWLRRHPYRATALSIEPEEQSYIDDAFTRFWRASNDRKIMFQTLAAALSYLHLCLHGVVMDSLRAHSRPKEDVIPEYGHPDEFLIEDHYHETELWETIASLLSNERERRIAFLHFHCNLKPREIIRFCPDEFTDEREIYQSKRNIIDRLTRQADLLRWKLGIDKER